MTAFVSIKLDDEQKARLDALAAQSTESAADIASRAVAEFLEHDLEFRAAVQEGLGAADRGEVRGFEEAVSDLRDHMARRGEQDAG